MSDHRFELFGRAPAKVLEPGSIADVQDAVRSASGMAIAPWGGGTRQQLSFAPERYDIALSLGKLNQVVSYQADDLTLTIQAGATLEQIGTLLGEKRQRLAVDVPLPGRATIGGAIATRADSLLRFSGGSVRDAILGVTVVNHAGEAIQGGGRVVKNVSGYDLPKLYCGSLGTLGAIVETTVRVVPLPESSRTVVLALSAGRNSEDALDTLLASPLSPSFLYLIGSAASVGIVPEYRRDDSSQYLIVGFDGSADAVAWQIKTLDAAEGELDESEAAAVRSALRDFPADYGETTWNFHILSSQVGAFLRMVEWTAGRSGFKARVAADAAVGMMWSHFTPGSDDADWEKFAVELTDKAVRCGGSFAVEKMPDVWRAGGMPVWAPILPDFELMKSLKKKLDPSGMWNPGRFIGGI